MSALVVFHQVNIKLARTPIYQKGEKGGGGEVSPGLSIQSEMY
jgi:hypothetical protein